MRARWIIATSLCLAACGGDGVRITTPDAPPVVPPDAGSFPACAEFSNQGVVVPARVDGTLTGADLVSPATCLTMNAPYGGESAGPDRVIPLRGLHAGATYVVKLTSAADLQFYVATGCSTATGPGSDQCLLFEDESLGSTELGRFVAGGQTAFVIVDFFASYTPSSVAFTLEVYEQTCQDDSSCTGAAPACFEGHCVECVSSFDCPGAANPRCDDVVNACAPGADTCSREDAAEPGDDGPAGAAVIALDAAGHATETASICAGHGEADFRAFEVTSLGQRWEFGLTWIGNRDLDLEITDARGSRLAMSLWEQPERAAVQYLAIGRYYVRVVEFGQDNPAALDYTLTTTRTQGAACSSSADCAGEFRNQLFRGRCDAGACVTIDGAGAVPEGGACDSQSDCSLALHCPSFFFVANGDTRETCARSCASDGECAPLGNDFVCTTYLANNFCVHKCTADDQCPTVLDQPPISGPWFRLSCDPPSGRCQP